MAQKKLLLVLNLLLLLVSNSCAASEDIVQPFMNTTMDAIKTKYRQLQYMLGDHGDVIPGNMLETAPVLKVFVSSSMNNNLLTQYAVDAQKYNATLVFNGLPDESWIELSKIIAAITKNTDEIAIQIDDEAFNYFGITSVPFFVLTQESGDPSKEWRLTHDKVSGNIGIRGALELFASHGDLSDLAEQMLTRQEKK